MRHTQIGTGVALVMIARCISADAGEVTKAFQDDFQGHTALYQTDFTEDRGWSLKSAKTEGGRFQHTLEGNWALAYLDFNHKDVLGADLDLAGKVTVIYYRMTSDDANSMDQTVVNLVSKNGAEIGARITYNIKNSLGTVKTQVTGFKDTADYSTYVQIRQVLDATEGSSLTMRLDRYDEAESAWVTMASVDIPDYASSGELGSSVITKLKIMLRSNDPLEDLAITQSQEVGGIVG